MTYKELLEQLQRLNEDQLHCDVTIFDTMGSPDEYYQAGVELVFAGQECDALGLDHPFIRF
jgi:hypothetical protein